jgi:hypothetical protein
MTAWASAAGRDLPGQLSLFWPIAVLLRGMADDGYSNSIFVRLLTDELATGFLNENPDQDLDGLTRALTKHLHGNAAMYFVARYDDGLLASQAFVETAATAFADMRSHVLLRAAQAKVSLTTTDTYTDELRARVSGLRAALSVPVFERLNHEIDSLEREISKEAASARLDKERTGQP